MLDYFSLIDIFVVGLWLAKASTGCVCSFLQKKQSIVERNGYSLPLSTHSINFENNHLINNSLCHSKRCLNLKIFTPQTFRINGSTLTGKIRRIIYFKTFYFKCFSNHRTGSNPFMLLQFLLFIFTLYSLLFILYSLLFTLYSLLF